MIPRRLAFLLSTALGIMASTPRASHPSLRAAEPAVTVVDRPDAAAPIDHYLHNRAPLAPSPLACLPMGAVRPAGWLRKQLELQADGFHGRLTEISSFLKKEGNAWLSKTGTGERRWGGGA